MRYLSIVALSVVACGPASANPGPEPASEMIRVPVGTTTATAAQIDMVKPTSTRVGKPLNQVWLQMSAIYDSLGVPLNTLDPTTHTIGNGDLPARRRIGGRPVHDYINCGNTQGGSNADTYELRMSVMSKLAADSTGGTTITTTIQAMGRPISTSGEFVRCSSTGTLEIRIADAAKAKSGG